MSSQLEKFVKRMALASTTQCRDGAVPDLPAAMTPSWELAWLLASMDSLSWVTVVSAAGLASTGCRLLQECLVESKGLRYPHFGWS